MPNNCETSFVKPNHIPHPRSPFRVPLGDLREALAGKNIYFIFLWKIGLCANFHPLQSKKALNRLVNANQMEIPHPPTQIIKLLLFRRIPLSVHLFLNPQLIFPMVNCINDFKFHIDSLSSPLNYHRAMPQPSHPSTTEVSEITTTETISVGVYLWTIFFCSEECSQPRLDRHHVTRGPKAQFPSAASSSPSLPQIFSSFEPWIPSYIPG